MDLWDISLKCALALGVMVTLLMVCNYAVLAERKVSAWIQGRVGPNRTTFPLITWIPFFGKIFQRWGLIQPLADGGKLMLKEDFTPAHVNKVYFILAPIIAFVPGLVTISVVQFGQFFDAATGAVHTLILANVDVGLLFIFAFSSLGVYAIVLSGWASNSKYPFLGGIRASAQLISYEIAMGLAVLPVFLWTNAPGGTGTLSLVDIVNAQQGLWFAIAQPVSFITFLIALFAETNRLPFDMPESETDLVGGYHTEYSSFKFGFFFVGEYANMAVGSAVVAVVFLGGWHPLPFVTWAGLADSWGLAWLATGVPGALIAFATCFAKMVFMLFFFIWVRWTVPRFRYDQVMRIGWRKLLPVAIGNLVVYAIAITVVDYYDLL